MGIIGNITNAVKDFFGGAAEEAFSAAGAGAYIAAASAIAVANAGKDDVPLDDERKALLRPDMGRLVDDVRITYDARLVELEVMGKRIGTNAAAQTFGTKIYVQSKHKQGDDGQLALLAHEMMHAKQYRAAGNPFEFGRDYFREYYRAGFEYADNRFEREADRFASCFMIRAGSDVQQSQTWKSNWSSGWTTVMPTRIGTEAYALLYKAGTGAARIVKIRAAGNGVDTVWEGTWSKGWSTFMPFALDGVPHFLAYKVGKGTVHIDRIRPGGNGVDTLWNDSWTEGWTSFMPFLVNNRPHYLAYKEGNGAACIDAIRTDGSGIDELWKDEWSKGWTSFMPFIHAGTPHFLAYKRGSGLVHIDRIKPDAKGYVSVWKSDWSSGWTNFVPLSSSGRDFLAYKGPYPVLNIPVPGDGQVHVSRVAADAKGTEARWCNQWRGSWTSVASLELAGVWHTLLYGADGDDIHIDRFIL